MSKEIILENYVIGDSIVDAVELKNKLNITTPEMNAAISKSLERGCPLVCVYGKLFRAKDKKEFERNLIKAWEMNCKTGAIEYAYGKTLTYLHDMEVKENEH